MNIVDIEVALKAFHLVKPYRIANHTIDKVNNCIVRLKLANGQVGLGAGAPIDFVTGETMDSCLEALAPENLTGLMGQSIYSLPAHTRYIRKMFKQFPAAAAALDMALYDAYAKLAQLPLVDILGRVHTSLPTSITIGIKSGIEDTLKEANEYIERGFKVLKVKLGENLHKDIETVIALHNHFDETIKIRVDMNQGYTLEEFNEFIQKTKQLDIELIEQPFAKQYHSAFLSQLPRELRRKIAADENVLSVEDMYHLTRIEKCCGIYNIKLMKCGGISPALELARIAELADVHLMWGCMDESVISISAALHAALASSKTKYLDLDGSFDLIDDFVDGGFILEHGYLRTSDKPGLGVETSTSAGFYYD